MDSKWAEEQLQSFIRMIEHSADLERNRWLVGRETHAEGLQKAIIDSDEEIRTLEPAVQIIMDAVDSDLRHYRQYDPDLPHDVTWGERWFPAREAALRALGLHTIGAEAKVRMRSDAPDLAADRFHTWVWAAAQPMWEAGSHREAVAAAARSVNARLQQKVAKHDISESKLCRAVFSMDPPKSDQPRLRFPGIRGSETWKSRQQGAAEFGAGCFQAIRNPLAHEHNFEISAQHALEQLAAFSVLARWIDECIVE